MRRGLAVAACAVALGLAPRAGAEVRIHGGAGVALDPAFAAVGAGADWFLGERLGLGLAYAHALPGAGDQRAVEAGYWFADALVRLRAAAGPRLRLEALGGLGVGGVRYGRPGAHRERALDATLGAAVGVGVTPRLEAAVEAATHVTFGQRTGTRNTAHTSETVLLTVRWVLAPG